MYTEATEILPHQIFTRIMKIPESPYYSLSTLFLSCVLPIPSTFKCFHSSTTTTNSNPNQTSHKIRSNNKAENMQSKLYAARRSSWILLSSHNRFTQNRAFCSATRSQTADPAIHSGELEAGPDVHKELPQVSNNTRSLRLIINFESFY